MQFGKFHGWAFVAFGVLMIIAQIGLFLVPRPTGARPGETPAAAPHVNYVPAAIGAISLAVGLTLVLANWNKKQE